MKRLIPIVLALACVSASAQWDNNQPPPTTYYKLLNVRSVGPNRYHADWTRPPIISSEKAITSRVTVLTSDCATEATGEIANLVIQQYYNRIYFEDGSACHVTGWKVKARP
ncbi:MAG: hypothetical protein ABSA54_11440 [Terriglobales bacterium]|jgi:hypothetical protein